MSRLIDADALREDILHDNTFDNDTINYYLNMVDGMETAYDVDKIVEKLKRLQEDGLPMRSAINIVKGAVKDERNRKSY